MKFIKNTLDLQFDKLNLSFGLKYAFLFLLSLLVNLFIFRLINISLISSIITCFYFMIPNKNIKTNSLSKITYIYLNIILVSFLGSITNTSLFLSLLLNLSVPFIIVCIFNTETNTKGHSVYYSIFIYVQFINITLDIFSQYLLSSLIGLLIGYIFEEFIWSKNYKNINSDIISLKKHFVENLKSNYIKLRNSLNLDSLISRFAVRLSVATAFSFVLWKYLNLPKWYWISMSTCFTLTPIYNENNDRAFTRIKGTILGAFIYLISSFFIKNMIICSVLALLSLLLMFAYLPYNRQAESFIFSTYFALSLSAITLSSTTVASYRIVYVLIGAFIAILFNQFLLPDKSKELCEQ